MATMYLILLPNLPGSGMVQICTMANSLILPQTSIGGRRATC